jgi:hypothetical protein
MYPSREEMVKVSREARKLRDKNGDISGMIIERYWEECIYCFSKKIGKYNYSYENICLAVIIRSEMAILSLIKRSNVII